MNIFRSLIGKVWHDPNAAEVVKISTGQLFLVRAGTIRSGRECIYNDAMATIRRIPSVEHNFQLVITRVYEDEDQELLEDEDETDHERTFLVDEKLEFRTGERDGVPTLVWRDPQGDVDEVFEFEAPETNAPTRAFFETCMYRAMFERKYRRGADGTRDEDLQEFIWQPPEQTSHAPKARKPSASASASTTPAVETPPIVKSEPTKPVPPLAASLTATKRAPAPDYPWSVSEPADLYIWDMDMEQYVEEGLVTTQVVHRPEDPPFCFHIALIGGDQTLRALHVVSSDMNQRFSHNMLSFTWNHAEPGGDVQAYCVRFRDEEALERFLNAYMRAGWEALNQMPFEKAKSDEQAYVMSSNTEDVDMAAPEDDDEEELSVAEDLDPENEPSDEEEDEEGYEDEDAPRPEPLGKGEKNSHLTVGYKGDAFVVRGSKIGVFRQRSDGEVQYQASIGNVATPKGKSFKPSKMMLHDQDTKMVIQNEDNPHSLFSMDIERGKIVEEWHVHDDVPVLHVAPESKFAQMTSQQTLIGASGNALFRIDPRVSGTKMVDSQFKQYATKQKFSGVTTTEAGRLAVGSEKGEIRLFDVIGKNAKTALPPLGDPILGIDVTADGRYIVATTKTYLLLIDTLIGEGRYAGSMGFDRSFPANAKPIPKRLQLRGEHVAYMGNDVSFSPARFNMGEGQEENAIVTSTGNYVVAWDFAKVKRGQLDKYDIKKYSEAVVQDNFAFGDDKRIVVALENNVEGIQKKNLKRPTRASLAPASARKSHSAIVNSPY